MNIAIVGTGYVGLVTGACFADTGVNVTCVDVDENKVEALKQGRVPIYEPGLDELVAKNYKAGRLKFTTSLKEVLNSQDVVFCAVGTPPDEDGSADLKYVLQVARTIGQHLNKYLVVVTKSTVPVGTASKIRNAINEELAKFSSVLAERPQIVVGNKCDLATEEQIETFRQYVEGKGLTFVAISAATMQGVKQLPGLVYNRLKDIPQVPVFTPEYKKPEAKKNGRDFTIQRMEAHVWSVDAPWLEYILAGSNVDDYESLQFFQRQLGESGILDALVQKGVEENDTILIGEYQFDYIF